ncbi:unnamed protein product, partial [Musa acuminata subsp. burmannicoides]
IEQIIIQLKGSSSFTEMRRSGITETPSFAINELKKIQSWKDQDPQVNLPRRLLLFDRNEERKHHRDYLRARLGLGGDEDEAAAEIGETARPVPQDLAERTTSGRIGALPDAEKANTARGSAPATERCGTDDTSRARTPLIVYGTEGSKIVKAFRAPQPADVGSGRPHRPVHLLDSVSGTFDELPEKKKGYALPRPKMVNADLSKIINSDEVSSVVRPIKKEVKRHTLKKNPLENLCMLLKMNPYAKNAKRVALLAEAQAKKEKLDNKRTKLPRAIKFKCYLLMYLISWGLFFWFA